jgi:trk system potassium uptake protein
MYIIVVGGGKVGYYLAKTLLDDQHEVLIIERDKRK